MDTQTAVTQRGVIYIQNRLSVNYDRDADILYVSIEKPKPSYVYKEAAGVVFRKAISDNAFSGATIMDFTKKSKGQLKRILPDEIDADALITLFFISF